MPPPPPPSALCSLLGSQEGFVSVVLAPNQTTGGGEARIQQQANTMEMSKPSLGVVSLVKCSGMLVSYDSEVPRTK